MPARWMIPVALAVLLLPSAAVANHGSPYVAHGTARLADAASLEAVLRWSGKQFGDQGTMTVELREPATHTLLHRSAIVANEDVRNISFVGCVEVIDPYRNVAVAGPDVFEIHGVMRNHLCTGFEEDDFVGSYLGLFALDVQVRGQFT